MIVLVINCGSSSVKYNLIETSDEKEICSGVVERIGAVTSIVKHEPVGFKPVKDTRKIDNHGQALKEIMNFLMDSDNTAISSAEDIKAVGHRVVHGGEMFKDSHRRRCHGCHQAGDRPGSASQSSEPERN
jgi:acetate kinase